MKQNAPHEHGAAIVPWRMVHYQVESTKPRVKTCVATEHHVAMLAVTAEPLPTAFDRAACVILNVTELRQTRGALAAVCVWILRARGSTPAGPILRTSGVSLLLFRSHGDGDR